MKPPLLEFITGPAGSGKTTTIRNRVEEFKENAKGEKNYATLTATTGIAAINMGPGVTTINGELGYFDTSSLQDNFACKKLHSALKKVSKKGKHLEIDEISMMDAVQLDLIHDALVEVNELQEVHNRGGLGLIISGDFCQLPPVKGEFAFNARCWKNFKITKLYKIYRQSDPIFLTMLNAARCGDGKFASSLIAEIPEITLTSMVDSHFEGTTIVPLNKYVDSLNKIRLDELIRQGKTVFEFKSYRWGRQLSEWKGIPEVRTVSEDSYIMILANDPGEFTYANGSCGYVEDADIDTGSVYINLISGNQVKVRKVTRRCTQKELPLGCEDAGKWLGKGEWLKIQDNNVDSYLNESPKDWQDLQYKCYLQNLTRENKLQNGPSQPYFDFLEEKWVVGEIAYTPIRLAYASTVHKSQGLSLDRVQIDYSHPFFGEPSMSYVSLSRVRTPAGLYIVGSRKLIEERTNITSEILPWI